MAETYYKISLEDYTDIGSAIVSKGGVLPSAYIGSLYVQAISNLSTVSKKFEDKVLNNMVSCLDSSISMSYITGGSELRNLKYINLPNVLELSNVNFANNYNLSYISLENCSEILNGTKGFENCYALSSIHMPNLERITTTSLFLNCTGLSEFITSKLSVIPNGMFNTCTGLKKFSGPSSGYTLGQYCFRFCTNLSDVNFSNITAITGHQTFAYCYALPSIVTLENCSYLGGGGIFNNTTATTLSFPVLQSWSYEAFSNMTCKKLYLGLKINEIPKMYECNQLEYLRITGESSFTFPLRSSTVYYCSNLKEVTIDNPFTLQDYNIVFSGASQLSILNILSPTMITFLSNRWTYMFNDSPLKSYQGTIGVPSSMYSDYVSYYSETSLASMFASYNGGV